jgi:hypothetical protein
MGGLDSFMNSNLENREKDLGVVVILNFFTD